MRTAASFETPRMRLRALDARDESLYCALYGDPRVMARIAPPLQAAAARANFLRAVRRNTDPAATQRHWLILDREAGMPMGLMALFLGAADRSDAELGIMLVPAAHGNGLAQELCQAAFVHAFGPAGWGLRRLWIRYAAGHRAVVGVMAAVGFEPGLPLDGSHTGEMTRERWVGRQG